MPGRSPSPSGLLTAVDALGRRVTLDRPPRRIVSLVPSLTETLFSFGLTDAIVGITRYCVEPSALVRDVPRIGGTKDPNIDQILALRPDLVVASAEENVREHVERLIAAAIPVYVSLSDGPRHALAEMRDLAVLTGRPGAAEPAVTRAETALDALMARTTQHTAVPYFCPIWRRPYMVAGPETYVSGLLRACGGESVGGAGPARYFPVELHEIMARGPAVILLPDEPYPFAERHRQEMLQFADVPAVRHRRVYLIDGQMVTWYGPRMAEALATLGRLLGASGDEPPTEAVPA